jgi:3-methyladenine DNA glycosylase AlkC
MVETRKPHKGQGVPKETPSRNSITDLRTCLVQHFPDVSWGELREELERREFFAAAMQQQVRILAEVSAAMVGEGHEIAALIPAMASSPVEKVRGVAAFVVPLAYPDDLAGQLQSLCFTGGLEGTWPRELSATLLHNLVIQHGVATILPLVQAWIAHPQPAIRRLVVESFRPRGVMLAHIVELKQDPAPLRAILEPLLDDESDYVRKAVANNLNDISRDNPEVVLDWAGEWNTPDASEGRRWILSRAMRTLVSNGEPAALAILGYAPPTSLDVTWLDTTPATVEINQLLPFEFRISNRSETSAHVLLLLTIDAPGKGSARRTSRYHLWKSLVGAGQTVSASKRVHFVDKSTQRKEPGTYRLIVTVNGEVLEERTMAFLR